MLSCGQGELMSLYQLKANTLEGKPADLSDYADKVSLAVNVASA